MNRKKVALIAAVVVLTVLATNRLAKKRQAAGHDVVRVSGNVEVTTVDVSFKIAGRMVRRLVDEGRIVTNGQWVAFLDSEELEQECAMRRAEAQVAEAVLAELEAGSRVEEIEQAEAGLEIAKADAARLGSEFARQKELYEQKVVAQRDYEAVEAAFQMASAGVREAVARLALLRKGAREETVRAARARLEQSRQSLALAETRLGNAKLTAPLSGVVLTKGMEDGEYVAPGTPVITVGNLTSAWVRAYVSETDLGRVRIGDPVKLTADTYPGKVYEGRLSFLAQEAEFTPRNIQTAKERVKLVYRIKVDVANPDGELKPGMPVDAEIPAR